MAVHVTHIPGFGNWDVVNNDALITEYFEMARAGREQREGNINMHVESHTKRGPVIEKISNIEYTNTDIKNGKKRKYVQKGRHNTSRPTEKMLIKQPMASPAKPGAMRERDGHLLMYQWPTSHKLAVHQRVPTTSRATISDPLIPVEKEVYQLTGTKKDTNQRRLKHGADMSSTSSIWSWKESGGNRTPSPSTNRPHNVWKEIRGSKTPSPSNQISNVQKEYGCSIMPSASPLRSGNEKLSSSKNQKKPLPKFGDWDLNDPSAGIAFTSIFDDARKEKNGAVPVEKMSPQMDAGTPVDEDLYKQPSYSYKKHGERLISILAKIFSAKMICQ